MVEPIDIEMYQIK